MFEFGEVNVVSPLFLDLMAVLFNGVNPLGGHYEKDVGEIIINMDQHLVKFVF